MERSELEEIMRLVDLSICVDELSEICTLAKHLQVSYCTTI